MNKPHITIRHLFGKTYYICRDSRAEAYGETPEESYKIWKQMTQMLKWKSPVGIAYKLETNMKPFSLLKYVKTTYSNSSKLL